MSRMKFTLDDLFNLKGSVIYNPDNYKPTSNVTIDSRKVNKGAIFVAIKGKKFDGHNFVREAVNNGAGAVIISNRKLRNFDDVDIPIITVPNTIKTFGELAKIKRIKGKYFVVGITGSNGKTTTKEFTSVILSEEFNVHFTEANNNNHIGVPLTILGAKNNDDIIVLELGTNHFGEIDYIAEIAQPNIALITNIGNAHTKFLVNKKGVLKEKLVLFEKTIKQNGKLLLNNDDKLLSAKIKKFPSAITFGFAEGSRIKVEKISGAGKTFPKLNFYYGKRKLSVTPKIYGKANLQNVINAVAIALVLRISNSKIKKGISKLKQFPKRFEIIELKRITIIDDSYNASPESMKSALESFAEISAKNKIAILGDMLELGEDAEKLHKSIGQAIKKARLDEVLLVGKMMKNLSTIKNVNLKYFKNLNSLIKYLDKKNLEGSTVLVKASRAMKLDNIIEKLMKEYS